MGKSIDLPQLAEQAIRVVKEAKVLVYDTEGSGVDWKRNSPCGYVITTDGFNAYIPVRHGGGQNLAGGQPLRKAAREPGERTPVHPFERALAKAFDLRGSKKTWVTIGHNLKYDLHMSLNQGIEIPGLIECTQLNAAMIDEHAGKYSLAHCCTRAEVTAKLGEPMYAYLADKFGCKPDSDSMSNFWRLPGLDPMGVDYAMGDGVSTMELQAWQRKELEAMDLFQIWRLEQELQRYVMRIERKGIRVDMKALKAAKKDCEKRITEAEKFLPKDFNPKAPTEVKKYLVSKGITEFDKTASGRDSFNEKFLLKSEAGRAIVKSRQMKTLMSSFIDPMINIHYWDGRVHATLNQLRSDDHGVIAGRFSCSEPNLQQITRRVMETGKIHRSIFWADDGYVFGEADFSQCEPRLFAHYSEDETIVAGYNAKPPIDLHSNTAALLVVERYPTAKRMGMGILTGMFPPTLAEHMGWELHKARDMYDQFMRAFPKLKQFQDDAKAVMLQRGEVRTLLGRVCHLDNPKYAYRAVSRIIQGGNADIMKWKLLQIMKAIDAEKWPIDILMTVHDSLVFQFKKGEDKKSVPKMLTMMADVQSEPFNLIVPFKVDFKSGRNWAEATFGDK